MRIPLRKLLFWTHLTTAVCAGAVILLMAGTGLVLSFEAQIQGFADREARAVAPLASGSPSVESTLAAVAAQRPDLAVSSLTLRRDPAEAMSLALGRDGVLYVDPHRSRVIGPGAVGVRRTLRAVTDLHRYLAAAGERRPAGKAVTGAANLAFLLVLLTGLYIWVPRALGRVQLRNALWFRRGLTAKARDFNWHHVFGAWAVLPLVVIVASATTISYTWAADLVNGIGAKESTSRQNASRPPAPAGSPTQPLPLAALDLAGFDRALARARAEVPDWQSMTVRLPQPADELKVAVDRADRRGRPDLRSQLVVDRASGALLARERFAEQSSGRRARAWMRWLHTGEAGGLTGQLVAALACAAVLLLGWTGYALAWRRLTAWRRRRFAVRVPWKTAVHGSTSSLAPDLDQRVGP